jgi:hypothetical protein
MNSNILTYSIIKNSQLPPAKVETKVHNVTSTILNPGHDKAAAKLHLFAPTLGVTKFTDVREMILVKLCCVGQTNLT